ncbi:MAG TPA: helix-turn-helix domain-containing protein [Candidatus Paceibacterota bacterium]|nr:helix-turn-helix domain-containing protein [Candidatus Paceibacterota bacterium]
MAPSPTHKAGTRDMHSTKTCPIAEVAELLSDTWTMLIIRDLLKGPMRFCELERSLEGVSTRTLTLKLKKLMTEKVISKEEESHYYSITKQGMHLGAVIDAMRDYGKAYL